MAEHGSESKEGGPQLGIPVSVKELDDVLFRDVGNKMANDGRYNKIQCMASLYTHEINSNFRWPLVIDLGKQCATFLKYRDTNYLCALSPRDMECETIRLAILGALRLVCTVYIVGMNKIEKAYDQNLVRRSCNIYTVNREKFNVKKFSYMYLETKKFFLTHEIFLYMNN